jgi:hypothetical protein
MHVKKATLITLMILLLSLLDAHAQEFAEIDSTLESLRIVKSRLISALDSVNRKIELLQALQVNIRTKNDTTQGIQTILATAGEMRKTPGATAEVIKYLPKGAEVNVIGYTTGYFKVKSDSVIGYINEALVLDREQLVKIADADNSKPSSKKSSKRSKATPIIRTASVDTVIGDRTIYTGPRGGKYYLNANGEKIYISKKKK